MSEVTRFRLARDVQRRMPPSDAIVRVVRNTGPNAGGTQFVWNLRQIVQHDGDRWEQLRTEARNLRADGNWFVNPDKMGTPTGFDEGEFPEGPSPPLTLFVDEIRKLDVWLAAECNDPRPADFAAELENVAARLDLDRHINLVRAVQNSGHPFYHRSF
jgi:hypothetical protein